eukprot:2782592-Ditylum_brightwellii.AAC.1
MMYDMTQKVNHAVSANRLNLLILDEEQKTALLINVTCPMDINIVSTAAKKHQKYKDLEIAMNEQFRLHKIQTVPIVIGALDTLCQNLDTNLAKVSPRACSNTIKTEVLL